GILVLQEEKSRKAGRVARGSCPTNAAGSARPAVLRGNHLPTRPSGWQNVSLSERLPRAARRLVFLHLAHQPSECAHEHSGDFFPLFPAKARGLPKTRPWCSRTIEILGRQSAGLAAAEALHRFYRGGNPAAAREQAPQRFGPQLWPAPEHSRVRHREKICGLLNRDRRHRAEARKL